MSKPFKKIGIIARIKNSRVKKTLQSLITFLTSLNVELVIENDTADFLPNDDHVTAESTVLGKLVDCVIVVGGDGSLLNAAHNVVEHNVPVLGINRGSLGFLTDILPSELNKIQAILEGEYTIEKRFLLTSKIALDGELVGHDSALNEVALIPDIVPHMLEFEIYINKEFVCSQNSDGLIIATPTGSTAYALSGGGPILHPQLDAIVLVPMFPHTLSSRPIVVEGNQKITIIISPNNTTSPRVTCDGQQFIMAPPNSVITIEKKSKPLYLVHPLDYNYYETLRSKLHWGKKLSYNG